MKTYRPHASSVGDAAANLIAVVCYLSMLLLWSFGCVPILIIFFIEKKSGLVRFHAMQALLLWVLSMLTGGGVYFDGLAALITGSTAYLHSPISWMSGLGVVLVRLAVSGVILVAAIVAAIRAYRWQDWRVPFIGQLTLLILAHCAQPRYLGEGRVPHGCERGFNSDPKPEWAPVWERPEEAYEDYQVLQPAPPAPEAHDYEAMLKARRSSTEDEEPEARLQTAEEYERELEQAATKKPARRKKSGGRKKKQSRAKAEESRASAEPETLPEEAPEPEPEPEKEPPRKAAAIVTRYDHSSMDEALDELDELDEKLDEMFRTALSQPGRGKKNGKAARAKKNAGNGNNADDDGQDDISAAMPQAEYAAAAAAMVPGGEMENVLAAGIDDEDYAPPQGPDIETPTPLQDFFAKLYKNAKARASTWWPRGDEIDDQLPPDMRDPPPPADMY